MADLSGGPKGSGHPGTPVGFREVTTPGKTGGHHPRCIGGEKGPCNCRGLAGESFTWEGFDPKLDTWVAEHSLHMEQSVDLLSNMISRDKCAPPEVDQLRQDRDDLAAALEWFVDHGHLKSPACSCSGCVNACALLARLKGR